MGFIMRDLVCGTKVLLVDLGISASTATLSKMP